MANGSDRKLILIWLLGQIYRAEKRKQQLDERLMRINAERDAPIGGVGYEPLPRSNGTGSGAASILLKLADIEERIYAQKAEIERSIVRVMDILAYLPVNSLEREICELRHIDMKSWRQISEQIPMSRSACAAHYSDAIDLLLQNARIQEMCDHNRDAYWDWVVKKKRTKKDLGK